MTLLDFLNKRNLTLSDKSLKLCQKGIDLMSEAINLTHNRSHVEGLLDNLDQFIEKELIQKNLNINFDVLLLAICWHDVWKASVSSHKILSNIFWEPYYDGIGSVKIFNSYAKKEELGSSIAKEVAYCIRNHSFLKDILYIKPSILPDKLEAKILRDIDGIDVWYEPRLKHSYQRLKGLKKKTIIYFSKIIIKKGREKKKKNFFFTWPKEEFLRKSKSCLKMLDEI